MLLSTEQILLVAHIGARDQHQRRELAFTKQSYILYRNECTEADTKPNKLNSTTFGHCKDKREISTTHLVCTVTMYGADNVSSC